MSKGVGDFMSQGSIDAFWSKVGVSENIADCWHWMGAKKPKGYGNVRINSKYMIAHRVAFELANNIAIPSGMIICHTCDNPSCCNPAHLMLGTIKSNYFDMINKGRQEYYKNKAKGERNSMSKLNAKSVKLIRKIYQRKEKSQYELADMFNVSQACIGSIVRNETWRNING